MKNRIVFLIVATLSMAGSVAAQTSSGLEKQLVDLSNRKFYWLIEKKYDSLETLLDDRLKYVHSNGWVEDKKAVLDDLKTGKLNYVKISVKESTARLYDKTAIINGLGTFEGTAEGKSFTMDLRFTEVYVKNGKQWKLASRHANRMP